MIIFQSNFGIPCSSHGSLYVFSIQGPLHLNKLTQQILKDALQNHEF